MGLGHGKWKVRKGVGPAGGAKQAEVGRLMTTRVETHFGSLTPPRVLSWAGSEATVALSTNRLPRKLPASDHHSDLYLKPTLLPMRLLYISCESPTTHATYRFTLPLLSYAIVRYRAGGRYKLSYPSVLLFHSYPLFKYDIPTSSSDKLSMTLATIV